MNIIEELKAYSTSTISDALDSLNISGGLNVTGMSGKRNISGRAFTVSYRKPKEVDVERKIAADFIDFVSEDYIPVLANHGNLNCTIWGEILSNVATLKKISGVIIDGNCRDIEEIRKLNFTVFSKGVFMQSGKGRTVMGKTKVTVNIDGVKINFGDYVRGDANGVVIIPQTKINDVLNRCKTIECTENKILAAVKKGMKLSEARLKFNYSHSWRGSK